MDGEDHVNRIGIPRGSRCSAGGSEPLVGYGGDCSKAHNFRGWAAVAGGFEEKFVSSEHCGSEYRRLWAVRSRACAILAKAVVSLHRRGKYTIQQVHGGRTDDISSAAAATPSATCCCVIAGDKSGHGDVRGDNEVFLRTYDREQAACASCETYGSIHQSINRFLIIFDHVATIQLRN